MTDPFDGPGSTSSLDLEKINGRLLLVKPIAHETNVSTKLGPKDAIRADVTVLDGPGAPDETRDVLIFPKMLISQVKSNAGTGRFNLGRLGKGQAKPGQSEPWILADPTEPDKVTARTYLKSAEAKVAMTDDPPF